MTPNAEEIKNALIQVLQSIQHDSGLECPAISGDTKPTEQLPEFDSKIWPVATGILADKLGINIPNDINIFAQEKTHISLTVDETVAIVMELASKQSPSALEGI
jgi:hypothetical protein